MKSDECDCNECSEPSSDGSSLGNEMKSFIRQEIRAYMKTRDHKAAQIMRERAPWVSHPADIMRAMADAFDAVD